MRICLVIGGTGTGGMERHVADLANEMSSQHEVFVIAHSVHADLFSENVHFVPLNLGTWRYNLLAIARLVRSIRRLEPDLVHAHHRKAGTMVASASRFLDMPLVLTVHSMGRTSRMVKSYDHVIGVSDLVTENIAHLRKSTILNGNG